MDAAAQQAVPPKAFEIHKDQDAFEFLSGRHNSSLMDAFAGDIDKAFKSWVHMLRAMEAFSKEVSYDIDGTKMLFKVFWNEDGSIASIAFFLRPNSRNIDPTQFAVFLKAFTQEYKLPVVTDRKFAHYGGASFPVYAGPRQQK